MIPIKLASPNNVENGIYAGDTWRGFTVRGSAGGVDPTDILPNLVSCRLQFRDLKRRLIHELNSATGSENGLPTIHPPENDYYGMGNITILDPVLWVISVDSQPLPMVAGTYLWELETLDIMNTTRSILNGRISICQDIAR